MEMRDARYEMRKNAKNEKKKSKLIGILLISMTWFLLVLYLIPGKRTRCV